MTVTTKLAQTSQQRVQPGSMSVARAQQMQEAVEWRTVPR